MTVALQSLFSNKYGLIELKLEQALVQASVAVTSGYNEVSLSATVTAAVLERSLCCSSSLSFRVLANCCVCVWNYTHIRSANNFGVKVSSDFRIQLTLCSCSEYTFNMAAWFLLTSMTSLRLMYKFSGRPSLAKNVVL